ncbi:unnamed protein product [Closterium sp. NIES-65]|nr:unnamed protein product [Closterium sp. NIES-65]
MISKRRMRGVVILPPMKHIKIKPARIVSVDVPGGKALVGEVISGQDVAAIDVSVLGWAVAVPQSLICLFPPPPHEAPLLAATASSAPVPPSCGSMDDPPSTPPAPRPSPLLSTCAANNIAATTATPRPPTAATVVTPGAARSVAVALGVPASTSPSACAPTAAVHAVAQLLSSSLPSAPRFRCHRMPSLQGTATLPMCLGTMRQAAPSRLQRIMVRCQGRTIKCPAVVGAFWARQQRGSS